MLVYAAESNIGFTDDASDHIQEDFVHIKKYDTSEGEFYLGIIADGAGSYGTQFQPARLASIQVEESVGRLCKNNAKDFLSFPHLFLQEAMISAGNVLGAFRMADEQRYNGFATSMSCVLIHNNKFFFAHTGNTRIHLIRISKKTGELELVQLSVDQTKGMEAVNNGEISFMEYHLHPARLEITGGLGISFNPKIQTFKNIPFEENQFILLTTDGIHNAIRADVILEILKRSQTCEEVVKTLILAAKTEKYEDNMAALLLWNTPLVKEENKE